MRSRLELSTCSVISQLLSTTLWTDCTTTIRHTTSVQLLCLVELTQRQFLKTPCQMSWVRPWREFPIIDTEPRNIESQANRGVFVASHLQRPYHFDVLETWQLRNVRNKSCSIMLRDLSDFMQFAGNTRCSWQDNLPSDWFDLWIPSFAAQSLIRKAFVSLDKCKIRWRAI